MINWSMTLQYHSIFNFMNIEKKAINKNDGYTYLEINV